MFTVNFTLRNAMIAAAMWLSATKLLSSFSYRTNSLRKRLNQLWQTSTTHRRALLVGSRFLAFASVRRPTTWGIYIGDVAACCADAVIGLEVHPLVLHAAPQALDEDVVPPGTAPVHRQLAARLENDIGELLGGELAALVGVDDLGRAEFGPGASSPISTT
jgi:hypothetical protein